MKNARKFFVLAALALLLVGVMSSCRAGCGGCPTWSLELTK